MPAKDLGTKFNCVTCGTKFYDLKKPDPICPKCGTNQNLVQPPKPTSSRRAKEKVPAIVEPEVELDEAVDEDEDAVGTDDAAEDEADEDF